MQMPLACPCCLKPMKKAVLDRKMYFIHTKCFDCVIDFETKLRQEGKYVEYEQTIINNNVKSYIDDMEQAMADFLLSSVNDSVVTEDGDVEHWVGGKLDKNKIEQDFKEYMEKLKQATINNNSTGV